MKHEVSALQKSLNVWAVILIVWSIYRAYFRTDLPIWFDEFIAKPLVFILPVYWYIVHYEKKIFFEDIYLKFRSQSQDILLGLGIGLIFFFTGLLGYYFKHNSFSFWEASNMVPSMIIFVVITAIATSISEEILSRGFILKRLYENSNNIYSSSFFASILFFFLHVPILFTNERIVGALLLQFMFTDIILSLTVSLIFLMRRSLILPILIHAFYNVSIYLFQVTS